MTRPSAGSALDPELDPPHEVLEISVEQLWRRASRHPEDLRVTAGRCVSEGRSIRAESLDPRHVTLDSAIPPPGEIAGLMSNQPGVEALSIHTVARRVSSSSGEHESHSSTVLARTEDGATLVADLDDIGAALSIAGPRTGKTISAERLEGLPLLFLFGSGGVLIHEIAGHPLIAGHKLPNLPDWLTITDDPSIPGLGFLGARDDCGRPTRAAQIHRGEIPAALRRSSFRDVPLPRMSSLVVEGNAPFEIPDDRIEIHLIEHGAWDPDRDVITLNVQRADVFTRAVHKPAPRFTIEASRNVLAGALSGARGRPVRYPGVICSEEGQRVPVGTRSVDLLLEGAPIR
ncbi:MAG: hypothetical protein KY459_07745 [Acidobacteria bacterium]|nr:hypothetical protein [Acidobacteriota bacterium]